MRWGTVFTIGLWRSGSELSIAVRYLQDLEILANRNDDKFSQKVRNLKSHDTLEQRGLAIFVDGRYYITDEGRNLGGAGVEILGSLMDQGFTSERVRHHYSHTYT